jgi:hypothetical protein
MLYLRPALKYFCSLSLHEDLIYDADSSFVNKVEKKPPEKPNVNSLFYFCLLSKMFVSPSPLIPLSHMHPLLPPQAPRRPQPAVRYTLPFTRLAASWTKRTSSPRVSTFEIRFVSSSC